MWFILLITAVSILAYIVQRRYTYWERTKVPYVKPSIPLGSLGPVSRKERSMGQLIMDLYETSTGKVLGIYLFCSPAIMIRDAELSRQIVTSDFASFHDRGVDTNLEDLFSLRGQAWKTLRAKLTPSFTSGKLKGMFGIVNVVGDRMVAHVNKLLEGKPSELLEVKSIFTTYAVDVIATVIFGLDMDSFANPNSELRQISRELFMDQGFIQSLRGVSAFVFPSIVKVLDAVGFKDPLFLKIKSIIERTVKYREDNNVVRKDMLQLLIQLRNTGKISEDDKNWDIETAADQFKSMSIEMIAAQAFLFYLAGTETTAATAAFTLYELAMYPEILDRAQAEVSEVYARHGLKPTDPLTYDILQEIKFMDLCIMETVRKYPGLPFLNRECTQDFDIPGTEITIKKGTPVVIPLLGIHRDAEYFPDPMTYDPERFSEDNRNYSQAAYMPFGEGPRHCIAMRMGKINSKLAVVKMLANFNVTTMPRKEVEFKFDPNPALVPKDGLNVRLSKKV